MQDEGHLCRDCGHVVIEHKQIRDGSWYCFYGWALMGFICSCHNGFEIVRKIK